MKTEKSTFPSNFYFFFFYNNKYQLSMQKEKEKESRRSVDQFSSLATSSSPLNGAEKRVHNV